MSLAQENLLLSKVKSCGLRTIEEVGELSLIRTELEAFRVAMMQLQKERDMAVDKSTKVSILLVDLMDETDESCDQLTESHALVEQRRTPCQQCSPTSSPGALKRVLCQQGSPISPKALKCGSFSAKKDDTSIMSFMLLNKSLMSSNKSARSSNKSVTSSNRSFTSSTKSVNSSNGNKIVAASNPFYL